MVQPVAQASITFKDFEFKSIGKAPSLFKRLSSPDPTAAYDPDTDENENEQEKDMSAVTVTETDQPHTRPPLAKILAKDHLEPGTSAGDQPAPTKTLFQLFQEQPLGIKTPILLPRTSASPAPAPPHPANQPSPTASASSASAKPTPSTSTTPVHAPPAAALRAVHQNLAASLARLNPPDIHAPLSELGLVISAARQDTAALLTRATAAVTLAQHALTAANTCAASAAAVDARVGAVVDVFERVVGEVDARVKGWAEGDAVFKGEVGKLGKWTGAYESAVESTRKRKAEQRQLEQQQQCAAGAVGNAGVRNDEPVKSRLESGPATSPPSVAGSDEAEAAALAWSRAQRAYLERKRVAEEELRKKKEEEEDAEKVMREEEERLQRERERAEEDARKRREAYERKKAERVNAEREERERQKRERGELERKQREMEAIKDRAAGKALQEKADEQERRRKVAERLAQEQEKAAEAEEKAKAAEDEERKRAAEAEAEERARQKRLQDEQEEKRRRVLAAKQCATEEAAQRIRKQRQMQMQVKTQDGAQIHDKKQALSVQTTSLANGSNTSLATGSTPLPSATAIATGGSGGVKKTRSRGSEDADHHTPPAKKLKQTSPPTQVGTGKSTAAGAYQSPARVGVLSDAGAVPMDGVVVPTSPHIARAPDSDTTLGLNALPVDLTPSTTNNTTTSNAGADAHGSAIVCASASVHGTAGAGSTTLSSSDDFKQLSDGLDAWSALDAWKLKSKTDGGLDDKREVEVEQERGRSEVEKGREGQEEEKSLQLQDEQKRSHQQILQEQQERRLQEQERQAQIQQQRRQRRGAASGGANTEPLGVTGRVSPAMNPRSGTSTPTTSVRSGASTPTGPTPTGPRQRGSAQSKKEGIVNNNANNNGNGGGGGNGGGKTANAKTTNAGAKNTTNTAANKPTPTPTPKMAVPIPLTHPLPAIPTSAFIPPCNAADTGLHLTRQSPRSLSRRAPPPPSLSLRVPTGSPPTTTAGSTPTTTTTETPTPSRSPAYTPTHSPRLPPASPRAMCEGGAGFLASLESGNTRLGGASAGDTRLGGAPSSRQGAFVGNGNSVSGTKWTDNVVAGNTAEPTTGQTSARPSLSDILDCDVHSSLSDILNCDVQSDVLSNPGWAGMRRKSASVVEGGESRSVSNVGRSGSDVDSRPVSAMGPTSAARYPPHVDHYSPSPPPPPISPNRAPSGSSYVPNKPISGSGDVITGRGRRGPKRGRGAAPRRSDHYSPPPLARTRSRSRSPQLRYPASGYQPPPVTASTRRGSPVPFERRASPVPYRHRLSPAPTQRRGSPIPYQHRASPIQRRGSPVPYQRRGSLERRVSPYARTAAQRRYSRSRSRSPGVLSPVRQFHDSRDRGRDDERPPSPRLGDKRRVSCQYDDDVEYPAERGRRGRYSDPPTPPPQSADSYRSGQQQQQQQSPVQRARYPSRSRSPAHAAPAPVHSGNSSASGPTASNGAVSSVPLAQRFGIPPSQSITSAPSSSSRSGSYMNDDNGLTPSGSTCSIISTPNSPHPPALDLLNRITDPAKRALPTGPAGYSNNHHGQKQHHSSRHQNQSQPHGGKPFNAHAAAARRQAPVSTGVALEQRISKPSLADRVS